MDPGTAVGRRGFLAAAGGTATAGLATRPGDASVDPDLTRSSGRTLGVVRFENSAGADRETRGQAVRERLKDHASQTQQPVVDYVSGTQGMEIRRRFWLANAVLVAVDTDRASFGDLATLKGVDRVHRTGAAGQPDRDLRASTDGASATTQVGGEVSFGLDMMNVPAVWDRFDTRGEGARIAIIDTGVDPAHPDVDLEAWAEFDADGERVDSDPHDPNGHGTGMSSLATGGDASGTQIGVAPDADLLVARNDSADFFTSTIAALEWAVENDADVASISLEFGPLRAEAIEPVANAMAAGTVVVSPAIVDPETYFSPGSLFDTLGTGVLDSERRPYRGGNGGEIRTARYWRGVSVPDHWPERYTAPKVVTAGVDVLAAVPDNEKLDGGHRRASGYSNGPPHVSGVVALLRSLDGDLSPSDIGQILVETAEQPGDAHERPATNGDFGHGIVNAAAAAAAVRGRDREVSGRVTDSTGEPVADARVAAVTGDANRTDVQGRYALSVPPGEATLTVSAVGYEPVERRVDPGEGRDLTIEAERRLDIRRTARPPARATPGERLSMEFAVEHAEFATVFVNESAVPLEPGDLLARVNGEPIEIGEPTNVEGAETLELELRPVEGARGILPLSISLADGNRNASLEVGPIHVHDQPMTVAEGEDLQAAIDCAAPETSIRLAGDQWDLAVESFESPFPASRFDVPVFEASRNDEAGLLLDRPVELTAADGHEPTLVASGGSGDRTYGIEVTSHFAAVRDLEVVAEEASAAVKVLDGDGVDLEGLDLSGADHGVYAQFTKSLAVLESRIEAAQSGVTLRDLSVNAHVRNNVIRDAERGVFLSGRAGEKLFEVDATVTDNEFESVGTDVETEGTATVRGADGTRQQASATPAGDSMLDLLLYAATATALSALFYPYGRRRFG